jgi:hypothetical protein
MRKTAISLHATAANFDVRMHFVSQRGGDATDIRIAPMGQTRKIVPPCRAPIINSTALRVEATVLRSASIRANYAMENRTARMGRMRRMPAQTVSALPSVVSLNVEARLKEALVPVQLARKLEMTRGLV